ncbi:phosphonate ABC transporter, permease protein PhnE [Humitalea sp. 24SJ18S-53]|uniref:phosphonate ABC transporter, permease protein PhnE n=1 Tax=Humitalea sp. 24SJ18S-53 TaxID=3422307 RepID=UPI003D66978C
MMTPALVAATARVAAHRGAAFRARSVTLAGFGALVLLAAWIGEVDLAKLFRGLPMIGDYLWRTVPSLRGDHLADDLHDWFWGLREWVILLGDTLLIAYVGTVFGAAVALLASFPAATTLAPDRVVWPLRRVLEAARTVPTLVFALLFVFAFGLGPLAGVLAIAMHTAGALGKLFAEIHENADHRQVEAIRAAGGTWAEACRFGVLPQSMPGMLSLGLLRFEINVREASVLGLVGAGGIGEELYLAVRQFEYTDISAILLLIMATIVGLDSLSGFLRRRVIGVQ